MNGTRPEGFTDNPHIAAVYDWLAANGIDEMLPEDPRITVSNAVITFTAFVWVGEPGWDAEHMHPDGDTITRSVPLTVDPSPEVCAVLREVNLFATLFGRR